MRNAPELPPTNAVPKKMDWRLWVAIPAVWITCAAAAYNIDRLLSGGDAPDDDKLEKKDEDTSFVIEHSFHLLPEGESIIGRQFHITVRTRCGDERIEGMLMCVDDVLAIRAKICDDVRLCTVEGAVMGNGGADGIQYCHRTGSFVALKNEADFAPGVRAELSSDDVARLLAHVALEHFPSSVPCVTQRHRVAVAYRIEKMGIATRGTRQLDVTFRISRPGRPEATVATADKSAEMSQDPLVSAGVDQ